MQSLLTLHQLFQRIAQDPEKFISAVFSSSKKEDTCDFPYRKVTLRKVILKNAFQCHLSYFDKTQVTNKNVSFQDLVTLLPQLAVHFKQITIRFSDAEFHITAQKEKEPQIKQKKHKEPLEVNFSHNRQKNYLLQEEEAISFFIELGIMNKEGKVRSEKRDKFVQINRFLELLLPIFKEFKKEDPIHIVDLGCGKALLSFAIYYYLTEKEGRKVFLEGVDVKESVIKNCQTLAHKFGYHNLSFSCQKIAQFEPKQKVDLVLALHACDVATDEAIVKGIQWKAKAIACAPCCQHEISKQLQKKAFPILLKHGLFHERFAALVTDALRVELLELMGYKSKVAEFVDPEHTPKNLIILAINKNDKKAAKHWKEYQDFTKALGIFPSLEKLLS